MFSAKNFGNTEKVEKIRYNTNSSSPYFRYIPTRKTKELLQLTSQSAIRCSKLTIETLEQGVKYVQI